MNTRMALDGSRLASLRIPARRYAGSWATVGTAFAMILVAACGDAGPEAPPVVTSFCPRQYDRSDEAVLERSDGSIIAAGILTRSSDDLLFDIDEFDDLSEEADRVLSLAWDVHPAIEHIHARDGPIIFGQIVVGLEPDLAETVRDLVADKEAEVTFVTGNEEFDALNARLGLLAVETLAESALLCLSYRVNLPAAVEAYSDLEGIRYAESQPIMGDGPDIDASRRGGTWYVVLRDAWGDCLTGCREEELYFYKVEGDAATAVDATEAVSDQTFAELVPLVGSRR
jgi:hypothetical protein